VLTGTPQAYTREALFVITRIEIVGAPADAEAAGVWHLTKGLPGFFPDDASDCGFCDSHNMALSTFKYTASSFLRQETLFLLPPAIRQGKRIS